MNDVGAMNEAVGEVVSLCDRATHLLFEWMDECEMDVIVTGDLDASEVLVNADALSYAAGASLPETLHVVDVLATFVADQLSVDCPPLQERAALIAAFDEADDIARTVVEYHAEVLSLDDLTFLESAVAYGETLALHEDWRAFQQAVEEVVAEVEIGARSSLLDLGACLFVLDRVGVDRFRSGLLWFRSRVVAGKRRCVQ